MRLVPIPREKTPPEELYRIYRDHRLVPAHMIEGIDEFKLRAARSAWWELRDDETLVSTFVLQNIYRDETCELSMIPVSRFFGMGGVTDEMPRYMLPLWEFVFDRLGIRRIESQVPVSRGRTKVALRACGFRIEGRKEEALRFSGTAPEDVYVMGLLSGRQAIPEED